MRNLAILCLVVVLILLGTEIRALVTKNKDAEKEYEASAQDFKRAEVDSERLRADLNYFLDPRNLEKELRARFNYRKPDEKLIIIVPKTSTSTE